MAAAARRAKERTHAAPPPITTARSWAYQLQNYDFRELQSSSADILVVDYSVSGQDAARFTQDTVRALAVKPDGSRRIVLAYLSIGEAEDYRFYWKDEWLETAETDASAAETQRSEPTPPTAPPPTAPPAAAPLPATKPDRWRSPLAPEWLGDENEAWSGNFAVKFWHPGWQSIVLEGPRSYLARIVEAGFDGVYLDRVDAYYEHIDEHAGADEDMVDFVARIAQRSRAVKPDFLIVPQNGEELLVKSRYVALIDAIAKEDLLYGSPDQGKPNSGGQIANSIGWLSNATRAGRPVLVVEYLDDPAEIAKARTELRRMSMIPTFAPRLLDKLSPFAVSPEPEASRR